MKFAHYRIFIMATLEYVMQDEKLKKWFKVKKVSVNDGFILFHMKQFNNEIKLEIPPIDKDKSLYSRRLSMQWGSDIRNQLHEVLDHYLNKLLELQSEPLDATQ